MPAKTTMTTAELRRMLAPIPASSVRMHLRFARETMREPSRPACGAFMAYEPNRALCARLAALCRLELRRRETAKAAG